jgi:signal peptidase I
LGKWGRGNEGFWVVERRMLYSINKMKKRNPILSFFLSLIVPGLGQVYNGQLKKGIFYLLASLIILFLIGLTGVLFHYWGFVILILAIVIFKLLISIEAFKTSKKLREYELKSINQTWIYLIFTVSAYLVIWYGTQLNRELSGYETFNIPSISMEPSIQVGDKILAIRINPNNIELGDIVTFTREDGQKYLCRIVGLPNQEIQIIDDRVIINKNKEEWTKTVTSKDIIFDYQEYQSKLPTGKVYQTKKILKLDKTDIISSFLANKEQIIVPTNHFYVLGDNRNNSTDSRTYGTIPSENIEKKVVYVWWSNNKKRIGLRFD